MRSSFVVGSLSLFFHAALAQYQIWDIWQTTWDRSPAYGRLPLTNPINFGSPSAIGSADIVVNDAQTYQSVWGYGASLTDSSASILATMKANHPTQYNTLMNTLFDPTDGAQAAGLSFIRIPIGASDFSTKDYSLDDTSGDTSFSKFQINNQPSNVFSILKDIQSINRYLRIVIAPWSPPAWMKDSNTMNGGSLKTQYATQYATYFLKAVQGYASKGFSIYAVSIQNEPENENNSYPTCDMPVAVMAQIGTALRTLLNNNGFSSVKVLGYDHNWDGAAAYPVQLMQQAGNAFAGVQFHCYNGDVSQQAAFHTAFPTKEIYMTECSGEYGSDWWQDIKWYMDQIMIGAPQYNSHNGMMWNIALDGSGNPKLPGTTSCGGPGCRPVATVSSDGTYTLHQEYYAMAQASRGILPRDAGGPFGIRVGVSVGGNLAWGLRVGAYVTHRVSSTDWLRYSLVVLNWDDNSSSGWNPVPIQTTIEFRGTQAVYTFPVGVTTLWWYAPAPSLHANETMVVQADDVPQKPMSVPRA